MTNKGLKSRAGSKMPALDKKPSQGSLDEKLERIGVNRETFDLYCRMFVRNHKPFLRRQFNTEGWPHIHKVLTDDQIADHLAERGYYYGTRSGPETRFICIDVDSKESSVQPFKERVDIVHAAFPHAVALRSSDSGGVHFYQILTQDEPVDEIVKLTSNRLARRGLKIKPGNIEIFPNRSFGLRLPLGKGSWVIDPESLERISSCKAEDLDILLLGSAHRSLVELFDEEDREYEKKVDVYTYDSIKLNVKKNTTLNTDYKNILYNLYYLSVHHLFVNGKMDMGRLNEFSIEILKSGLTEPSTRFLYSSLLLLWSFDFLFLTPDEAYKLVSTWLKEKHNDKSEEFNADPEATLKLLNGQVRSLVEGMKQPVCGLTREEIRPILDLKLTFKQQLFLFDLLRFLKYHDNDKHLVNIGREQFAAMRGASKRSYIDMRDLAKKLGIILLEKNYSHQPGGKGSRTLYQHKVKFDHTKEEFSCLEMAIITLMARHEIQKRYSEEVLTARRLLELKELNPDLIFFKTFDLVLSGDHKVGGKSGVLMVEEILPGIFCPKGFLPHKNPKGKEVR